MTERFRIRINLSQQEFEIEGSKEFVQSYSDRIEELLGAFGQPVLHSLKTESDDRSETDLDLGSYGEFLQSMPNSSTEVDKILATGFYLQRQSGDQTFNTADSNRSLAEHGIRIGNPSQCVRQSLTAKRVFMVTRGRYRVSQQGRAYLRQLMGSIIPEKD